MFYFIAMLILTIVIESIVFHSYKQKSENKIKELNGSIDSLKKEHNEQINDLKEESKIALKEKENELKLEFKKEREEINIDKVFSSQMSEKDIMIELFSSFSQWAEKQKVMEGYMVNIIRLLLATGNSGVPLSESDFSNIISPSIYKFRSSIPGIIDISVNGAIINVKASSSQNAGEWTFSLDFNDFGMITGRYTIETDEKNKESTLPDRLGQEIVKTLFWSLPTLNKKY